MYDDLCAMLLVQIPVLLFNFTNVLSCRVGANLLSIVLEIRFCFLCVRFLGDLLFLEFNFSLITLLCFMACMLQILVPMN